MRKRNHYSAEFKTKVVLELLSESSTVSELSGKYDVSPVMITRWKQEFLNRASDVFKKGASDTEVSVKYQTHTQPS